MKLVENKLEITSRVCDETFSTQSTVSPIIDCATELEAQVQEKQNRASVSEVKFEQALRVMNNRKDPGICGVPLELLNNEECRYDDARRNY